MNAYANQLDIYREKLKTTNAQHKKTLKLVQDLIDTIQKRDEEIKDLKAKHEKELATLTQELKETHATLKNNKDKLI